MNKKMFRSMMAMHGDTYSDLGEALGITKQTVSDKVNQRGGAEFKQGEIQVIAKRYKMTPKLISECFFAE